MQKKKKIKHKPELETDILKNLEVGQRFKVIAWKGRRVNPGDFEKDIIMRLLVDKGIGYCFDTKIENARDLYTKPVLVDFGLLVGGGKKLGDNKYEYMFLLPASTEVEIH